MKTTIFCIMFLASTLSYANSLFLKNSVIPSELQVKIEQAISVKCKLANMQSWSIYESGTFVEDLRLDMTTVNGTMYSSSFTVYALDFYLGQIVNGEIQVQSLQAGPPMTAEKFYINSVTGLCDL